MSGHAVTATRDALRDRVRELEQEQEAIAAVLRAVGCRGDTALELATDAAETVGRTPLGMRRLATKAPA